MASQSHGIINLDDSQHPLRQISIQNEKSPLLRLPKEIRFMIYELAVCDQNPIKPRQIVSRSNKFCWGDGKDDGAEAPRTATQLANVCRRLYKDQEECMGLYRINHFVFPEHEKLHSFLVAITPERRDMIRRITLHSSWYIPVPRLDAHVLTMLLNCAGLREFVLSCDHLSYGVGAIRNLRNFLNLVKAPVDKLSLWNMPTFNLRIGNQMVDRYDPGQTIIPASVAGIDLNSEPAVSLLTQIQTALVSRKQRLIEEEKQGRGLKTMLKSNAFQNAVSAAKVDIPGEDRITQDVMNSSTSVISSRTRSRCQAENLDSSTGTIRDTNKGKYDAEGVLRAYVRAVTQVRWGESTIECKVSLLDTEFASWEELHAILSPSGQSRLADFYRALLFNTDHDANQLMELRDTPSPKEVTDISHGLLKVTGLDVLYWEYFQHQFEKLMKSLEDQFSSQSPTKTTSSGMQEE